MKILIVKISALGDVIHSLPVASLLKDTIPDLNLHYVVGELSKDLLINNPIIDKVFILPKSKNSNFLNSFINIIKAVRKEKYDAVIDLQGLLKSGLITGLTKAPIRIGFSKAREGANLFYNYRLDTGDYFDINQPIINQNLKLGQFLIKLLNLAIPDNPQIKFSFPIPDTINKEKIENLIKYHHNISSPNQDSALNESAQALIVFITKTTWVTKNYPESSFIQLINELAKKLSAKIILIGSSADAQTNQNIINGLDSKDNIYVADTGNHRIQKFDSHGNFLWSWSMQQNGQGGFEQPVGLAIDAADNIYVVDKQENSVQKFALYGGTANILPSWIKNTSIWWAEGVLDKKDFSQAMRYVANQGIIKTPSMNQDDTENSKLVKGKCETLVFRPN